MIAWRLSSPDSQDGRVTLADRVLTSAARSGRCKASGLPKQMAGVNAPAPLASTAIEAPSLLRICATTRRHGVAYRHERASRFAHLRSLTPAELIRLPRSGRS